LGKEVVPGRVVVQDGNDVASSLFGGGTMDDGFLEIAFAVDEEVSVEGNVLLGANGRAREDVFGRHHVGHDVGIGNDGLRGFDIPLHQEVAIEVIAQNELVGNDGVGIQRIGLLEPRFTALGTPRCHKSLSFFGELSYFDCRFFLNAIRKEEPLGLGWVGAYF